jgi:hypothetical protein
MGLGVIMRNLGQVLPRNGELIGQIVVARRHDHLARAEVVDAAGAVGSGDGKVAVLPRDGLDPNVLTNVNPVVLGDLAIIFERLFPCGLLQGSGERNISDFEW